MDTTNETTAPHREMTEMERFAWEAVVPLTECLPELRTVPAWAIRWVTSEGMGTAMFSTLAGALEFSAFGAQPAVHTVLGFEYVDDEPREIQTADQTHVYPTVAGWLRHTYDAVFLSLFLTDMVTYIHMQQPTSTSD